MHFMEYTLGACTDSKCSDFAQNQRMFWFAGRVGSTRIINSSTCMRSYLDWRRSIHASVLTVGANISSSSIGDSSNNNSSFIFISESDMTEPSFIFEDDDDDTKDDTKDEGKDAAGDDGKDDDGDNSDHSGAGAGAVANIGVNNQSGQPVVAVGNTKKQKPGIRDKLRALFKAGFSYDDIEENDDNSIFHGELITNAAKWKAYEIYVASKRPPLRKKNKRITDAMKRRYLSGDYGDDIINVIVKDWYEPNFVDNNPTKGNYILWLWSRKSSVGKTTFWEDGLSKIQTVHVLRFEHGWIEPFVPRQASAYVIDGVSQETVKNGLSLEILEAAGSGLPAVLPRRHQHIQPATSGEAFLITSNYPYNEIFDAQACEKVLATRVISIECSKRYPLFDLTNLILTANNLPERGSPLIVKPKNLRIKRRR